jgi:tetratricopeptide (TPR) repeat protein
MADETTAGTRDPELANRKKEEGNKAFLSGDYNLAIELYSEAINLDSSNAAFYSNRSACYIEKQDFESAITDSKECIKRNPDFLKGYYRLSQAYMNLRRYDDAINVVNAGLDKDPRNKDLKKQRQLCLANKKRARDQARQMQPNRVLDEAAQKEVAELRKSLQSAVREHNRIRGQIGSCGREIRMNQLTQSELQETDPTTPL